MNERGFISRRMVDVPTGAITKTIEDVDTSLYGDVPSGWVTPSGGGLNLVTDYDNDDLGRPTQTLGPVYTIDLSGTATPIRSADWTVYADAQFTVRTGRGYQVVADSSFTLINPVNIAVTDAEGRPEQQIRATRGSGVTSSGKLLPTDSFAQSSYTAWSTTQYIDCCIVASQRVYHTIPASGAGSEGTHYEQTSFGYDVMKRRNRTVTPGGTITFDVFNTRGQSMESWVGTDDTGATSSDPSGGGAAGNNMVQTVGLQYDNGNAGGNGNRTQQTKFVDDSTTRITSFEYDWRDRRTTIDGGEAFFESVTHDNLDHVIKTERYDTTASGNLVARSETRFDDRGHVYQSVRYAVDPATGTVGNSLTDNTWYDAAGNPIKELPAGAGESFTKRTFNSLGWNTVTYAGFGDDASYSDVLSVIGDVILQQTETARDNAGNVIQSTQRERYHNAPASQTGPLGSPALTPNARLTYTTTYPDGIGRTSADVEYGTAGGSGFTRSATIPATSDTVLVSRQAFDPAGELQDTTDPAGKVTRTNRDAAKRTVEIIDNYVASPGTPSTSTACSPPDDTNQTVRFTYTPDSNRKTITAVNADTGDQVTQYIYGTTLASSGIATSHLLSQEIFPDSTGPADRITHTYNRQSEETSLTDQNGSVRQFDRDALARPTQDRVTTLGAGVDRSVRRIERAYDVWGNLARITSLDNAIVGSGSVVNEVTFAFNDFNQSIDSGQSHDGAVIPGTTPSVSMAYADGSGNTIRPASITYPNGRTITRDYGTTGSITDKMNQVSSLIDDDSTVLAVYERLGQNTIVQQTSAQPDLRYTLISPTLATDPDTGDIYAGLDRFGRVKDVRWRDVSAGTDLSRIEYGYDRASNRIWRENPSDPNREHDWLYADDGLHRLQSAQRGQLNGTHAAMTTLDSAQCWTLDPTGNWEEFRQDDNGDGTWDFNQTRTANTVNEITDISNSPTNIWATPAYDKNGNTTTTPRPDLGTNATMTATFDAWNRLMKLVDDNTSTTLLENTYDGRNFRITAIEGTNPQRHYYFTDDWQCVEERTGTATTPERQHVWGIRYIDDLLLRDRATGASTALNERLYHLADANWNTTAIVAASGNVQERYEYTPYGVIAYFAPDFTLRSSSNYDTRYTYTNREWTLVAGLYYFRNRWYDAQLGRFCSRDPIGFEGSEWSLYEYCSSTPLALVDASGRNPIAVACIAAIVACSACAGPVIGTCAVMGEDAEEVLDCLTYGFGILPGWHKCACTIACGGLATCRFVYT